MLELLPIELSYEIISYAQNMRTLLVCREWYRITKSSPEYQSCIEYRKFIINEQTNNWSYNRHVVSGKILHSQKNKTEKLAKSLPYDCEGTSLTNGIALVWHCEDYIIILLFNASLLDMRIISYKHGYNNQILPKTSSELQSFMISNTRLDEGDISKFMSSIKEIGDTFGVTNN